MTTTERFDALIDDARSIRGNLEQDRLQLRLAYEKRHRAMRAHREAEKNYKGLEVDFIFELRFGDNELFVKTKNADDRELVKEHELIKARNSGILKHTWRDLNDAQTELDNAEMTYQQQLADFKASRSAAHLMAGEIQAMSSIVELDVELD